MALRHGGYDPCCRRCCGVGKVCGAVWPIRHRCLCAHGGHDLRYLMSDPTSENLDQVAAAMNALVAPESPQVAGGIDAELDALPTYARGLMHIYVPVQVTLA